MAIVIIFAIVGFVVLAYGLFRLTSWIISFISDWKMVLEWFFSDQSTGRRNLIREIDQLNSRCLALSLAVWHLRNCWTIVGDSTPNPEVKLTEIDDEIREINACLNKLPYRDALAPTEIDYDNIIRTKFLAK